MPLTVSTTLVSIQFVFHRLVSDSVKDQLLVTIQKTFNYSRSQALQIFLMVVECMKKKALVGLTGSDAVFTSINMFIDKCPVTCVLTLSQTALWSHFIFIL